MSFRPVPSRRCGKPRSKAYLRPHWAARRDARGGGGEKEGTLHFAKEGRRMKHVYLMRLRAGFKLLTALFIASIVALI